MTSPAPRRCGGRVWRGCGGVANPVVVHVEAAIEIGQAGQKVRIVSQRLLPRMVFHARQLYPELRSQANWES